MSSTTRISHRVVLMLGVAVGMCLGCEHSSTTDRRQVMRLAHGSVPDKPLFDVAQRFADIVNTDPETTVRIEVYGQSKLGDSRMVMESTAIGTLDMSCEAPLSPVVPEMALLELPYLFVDSRHAADNLEGAFGQALAKRAESRGLVVLGYYVEAGRNIFNRSRDVRTPDDLQGMKIRVPEGRVWVEMMNRFGASATPISWGEVYTAIEQNVIAGAEADLISIERARFYETCKHISETDHVILVYPHIMNRERYLALPRATRELLKHACREAARTERQRLQARLDKARRSLESEGVAIVTVDKSLFRDRVMAMHDRIAREVGAEDLLSLIVPPAQSADTPPAQTEHTPPAHSEDTP